MCHNTFGGCFVETLGKDLEVIPEKHGPKRTRGRIDRLGGVALIFS